MRGLNFVNMSPIFLLIAVSLVSEVQSFGCYSCWSNDTATPECATGPIIRMETVECPDADTCLTAIVGGSTFRGCSSSILLPEDYPLKETCDVEFCNYRVFPADRLICYKCQGNQCIQPAGNSRACLNYSPFDQCYTDVISETNTIRGCVSDGNTTATEYTFTCDSNLCNSQRSYEPLECLTCASNETLDCIRPADAGETCRISVETTCSMNVLLGRQEYCYTYQSGDYIQRGCSLDSAYIGKEPMNSVEYETKCYDGKCNNECIPQSVCYVCDSATNPNCGTNLTELTPETCTSQAISSCFTCLGTDGIVRRGCGTGDETGNCLFCNNLDGCNNRTLTRCYSCSSANDRDCVDPANSEGVGTILCDSNCIESIVDQHFMMRGCENPSLTCKGTDSSYCNTCEDELCNNAVKPLGALECYQCGKDNPCNEIPEMDIKPVTCKYYEPSDRCVQFYSKPYIIRGCLSDDIGEQCVDEGNECLNCDTSGCNDLPLYNAPSLSCIQCSSTEECTWGFQTDAGTPCKNDVFFWEQEACYLDRYNTTEVSRGCVLDSSCTNCKTCTTNNCNNENVIQQYCIQCNIQDNPNCSSVSTQDAKMCGATIQTYEDRGCYVLNKVNGHTYRGCSSSIELPEGYQLQQKCDFEFCNANIFPSNRLYCFKCEGDACASPTGSTRACLNYDANDLCYTNVFTESNITRGCMSDRNVTETPYLVTCDTNSCNKRPPIGMLSCIKCSSDQNRDCVRDPESAGESCTISLFDTCTVYPLLGRYDACYTKRNGDLVQRGCLSEDFDPEGPGENEENFEKCEKNICNNKCQPETMCYTCSSSDDPRCANDITQLQPQACKDYGLSTCFGCMNEGGIITRGCGSNNLTEFCLSCDSNGCNDFQLKYCYNCSSEDDPNCSQLTNPQELGTKVCYSDCAAKIIGQNTVRGCVADFETCETNDPNCKTCQGNLCNNEIIPTNRLTCYHCNGSTPCFNITSKNELSLPCVNYKPNDMCMAYLSKNTLIRGCLSDKLFGNDCVEAGSKCLTCSTPNCNGAPLLQPSKLMCISCYYITECAWGFQGDGGRQCRGDVPFYVNESCFTFQYDDGSVSRGCTLEAGCDSTNPNCKICGEDNCNNANIIFQNCIQCDSSSSPDCEEESDGSSATRCPGNIQTYQDRGCYVRRKDDKVTRGCIAQLTAQERNYCKDESNQDCQLCLEQACNKQTAPNKSNYLKCSTIIIALSLLFVFYHSVSKE